MNIHTTTIVSICSISLISSILASDTINPHSWIKTYICDKNDTLLVDTQDLQALLNLLYLSYARSSITLDAQDGGLQALQASWQAFQNIIQLRMNPAKVPPYTIDADTYTNDMNDLYELQAEHSYIGTLYAAAVEKIVQGSVITDEHLKKGIKSLRDDARRSIANSLSDVREYLDTILHTRNDKNELQEDLTHKSFSLGDYVWGLIPNLALNSFVKADDLTITMSEEWWKALYQLLNISNMVWKSVERARAELYLTYYKAVYLEAQSHEIDMTSMMFMFDEHGLLDFDKQQDQLPQPKTLLVPA